MKHIKEDKPRSFTTYQERPVSSYKCANGKTAIEYSPEYDEFETREEAGDAWPNNATILDWLNQKNKTASVAKSYQAAAAPFKAEYDGSPAKLRKDFVDSAVAGGKVSREDAEKLADSLGFVA